MAGLQRRVPRFAHGSRVPGWDEAVDLTKPPATVPDPATTAVPPALRAKVEEYMTRYPDRRSAAIPALHAAQELHGWCSPEAITQVAAIMRLTPAYLDSVATFYDMFSTVPKPRHDVFVCTNISCSLRGADEFFEAMLAAAAADEDVNVRSFECLGACDIAPMASVDGEYVGPLVAQDAEQIVEDLRAGRPVLETKQLRRHTSADTSRLADRTPNSIVTGDSEPGR
ncbi:MAG: NADH-quinone oxidoreductase subunit NuoE family protein [Solirubrobacteraceae bacterium]